MIKKLVINKMAAVVMTVVMLMTMLPVTVFAETEVASQEMMMVTEKTVITAFEPLAEAVRH